MPPYPFVGISFGMWLGFFAFMLPKLYVSVKPNVRPPREFSE
jgi:hypothetical protein